MARRNQARRGGPMRRAHRWETPRSAARAARSAARPAKRRSRRSFVIHGRFRLATPARLTTSLFRRPRLGGGGGGGGATRTPVNLRPGRLESVERGSTAESAQPGQLAGWSCTPRCRASLDLEASKRSAAGRVMPAPPWPRDHGPYEELTEGNVWDHRGVTSGVRGQRSWHAGCDEAAWRGLVECSRFGQDCP